MRVPHIFQPGQIEVGTELQLDDDAAGHIGRVLRMQAGQQVSLFNGAGGEYLCTISQANKKNVYVSVDEFHDVTYESPLKIHLGQGISRGEKMEFTIQKSVELGITEITPLFSERCGVKLQGERLEKKHLQWQKIAIAAAEQSGRNFVPIIHPPIKLEQWLAQESDETKLTLHPRAEHSIKTIDSISNFNREKMRFVVGPEGGFTDGEIAATKAANFIDIKLGPRVLRTETAALTVLSALQLAYGDLA
ncbi:16S rRNA (uracil(1498)-N(3))-methyltransferase [Pseudoalteromonas piratica]|uniref:Ribosomal RNA small subunit methyltransferase E n=1 Tax=Pseudoalteromonas piratica TaxID=1348114 RepID=A0A0A7EHG2_9GAMM|nr:16S rRNA (uracil(1498)-N(3))-methyltransferase [Pseudoalteromonas piratica]AIY66054.1 16S rRNA methyltransferase [Pseudoalteromonas piratica]